jgi:hypothetical protein
VTDVDVDRAGDGHVDIVDRRYGTVERLFDQVLVEDSRYEWDPPATFHRLEGKPIISALNIHR